MNPKLKQALKEEFAAPEPVRKEEFLRRMRRPPILTAEFVLAQAGYIRKSSWALALFVFAAALWEARSLDPGLLWNVSAMTPILAMTLLTESGRSEFYGMAELEGSTRFSLKSVVLARLGLMGGANLLLIGLLIPMTLRHGTASLIQTGVTILCPYFLTVFLGLEIVRRARGREGTILCAGLAVLVCAGYALLCQSCSTAQLRQLETRGITALILLCLGTAYQCDQMIRQTEEPVWNL